MHRDRGTALNCRMAHNIVLYTILVGWMAVAAWIALRYRIRYRGMMEENGQQHKLMINAWLRGEGRNEFTLVGWSDRPSTVRFGGKRSRSPVATSEPLHYQAN